MNRRELSEQTNIIEIFFYILINIPTPFINSFHKIIANQSIIHAFRNIITRN